MQRDEIVKRYFQAWLDQNIEPLGSIFSEDIVYSECYGPEYRGLSQILKWGIKNFIHQGMFTVAEWYFECDYNHEIGGFDGVSIIEFNDDMKIVNLKEFQSKAEHYFPYR